MTFDLRGIGASRLARHRHSLRGLHADILLWAREDFAAAVAYLSCANQHRPITVLGHSLGLHLAVLTDAATQARIAHAIGIASGAGYWRDWATPSRRVAPWLIYVLAPFITPCFGYFPGRRLRVLGDLPEAVMRQWLRWCRHPEFAWGAEPDMVCSSLDAARFPMTAFSFSDDESMTEHCTEKLLAACRHAPSRLVRVAPGEVGRLQIGHVGAFKAARSVRLWERFAAAVLDGAAWHPLTAAEPAKG